MRNKQKILSSLILIPTLLAACETITLGQEPIEPKANTSVKKTMSAPEATKAPVTVALNETASPQEEPPKKPRLLYFDQERGSIPKLSSARDNFKTSTLQLNFNNVGADRVVAAVLQEALGETVAIAEGVSGNITLTSPAPIPTRAALDALENVLSASDLALIENQSGFMLTTISEATKRSQQAKQGTIGFGVTLYQVQNTSASNITRLITPFIGDAAKVSSDDNQGVLTITGPKADVAQALDAIKLFDKPSLTDRVFGMFEVNYTEVTTLKSELNTLLKAQNSQSDKLVELIELPRLNRLFVIAKNKRSFDEVSTWITRLDVTAGGDERRLRYYVAQNSPANTLAQQISAAFGMGNGSFQNFSQAPAAGTQAQAGRQSTNATRQLNNNFSGGMNRDSLSIVPDELNNALIIRATDAEYREVLPLLERMDVLPPQVLIEATIAEVTLSDDLNFGIRWFFNSGEFDVTLSDNSSGATGPVFPGFSAVFNDGNLNAAAALNTLSSVTDVTVLSAPSIMVQNNQSANLQVGDEVPILTQQATATTEVGAPIVSTIQLRETGVILDVKPRINASDMVVLDVSQEVSEAVETVTAGINSPTIRQRQFTSTVAVRNNSTIALGGLIRESSTDNQSGIPLISRAPIVGNLFKSRNQSTRRTELIIFLTPRIIRNDNDAAKTLEYLQEELGGLSLRLEEM